MLDGRTYCHELRYNITPFYTCNVLRSAMKCDAFSDVNQEIIIACLNVFEGSENDVGLKAPFYSFSF